MLLERRVAEDEDVTAALAVRLALEGVIVLLVRGEDDMASGD